MKVEKGRPKETIQKRKDKVKIRQPESERLKEKKPKIQHLDWRLFGLRLPKAITHEP